MRKNWIRVLCVGFLLLAASLCVAARKPQVITKTLVGVAQTETITKATAGYVRSLRMTWDTSGNYTGRLEVINGAETNRLFNDTLSSGQSLTWEPNGGNWVAVGDILQITAYGSSGSIDCVAKLIIEPGE